MKSNSHPVDQTTDNTTHRQTRITILRHGESLHNVNHGHAFPDPPLTPKGQEDALQATITPTPDLILISPMTRTLQTAIAVFGDIITDPSSVTEVQIWPELREGYDHAICNIGISKAEITAKFPFPAWNFDACHDEWDYESHSLGRAMIRAQGVRRKLKDLIDMGKYEHIVLVSHRGFIAFLVQGERFATCENRSYRIASEAEASRMRYAAGVDTGKLQDFGPIVLLPV